MNFAVGLLSGGPDELAGALGFDIFGLFYLPIGNIFTSKWQVYPHMPRQPPLRTHG